MAAAQVSVLTQHYDNARTGGNLKETVLNPTNVRAGSFGKLFSRKVDGQVYAQPLYVANLNIGGKVRNVLFIATMHDSVYAFDADDPTATAPLWKRSFIKDGVSTTLPYQYLTGFGDIHPEVGILSTPVIDPATNTMYVLVRTIEGDLNPDVDGNYKQRLWALDLTTGASKLGGPTQLVTSVPGTGDGNDGAGHVYYSARRQNQRPALLLLNGIVYVASASHGDNGPYHGWLLGYDAATLKLKYKWNSTPNGGLGGIWQAGQGPAADEFGNIYLMTGNGSFDANNKNYGDSFVKLNIVKDKQGVEKLAVVDYFTPYNQDALNSADADLGSSGPLLVPGTDLIVGGGKEGRLFSLRRANMGKYNPDGDTQIAKWFWAYNGHLHGSPITYKSPKGRMVYLWSEYDRLKAFRFGDDGLLEDQPYATGSVQAPDGMPGGFLSVSANGTGSKTGIVWASLPLSGNANWDTVPGVLRAYDASTLEEIWNTRVNPGADDVGMFAKFCPPIVANGKVYLSTFSNMINVYGLLPKVAPAAPAPITATGGDRQVRLSWEAPQGATAYDIYRGTVKTDLKAIKTGITPLYYTDKTVVAGVKYYYAVRAKNKYGVGDPSRIVQALPYIGPDAVRLTPTADTFVHGGEDADKSFGKLQSLKVDGTTVESTCYTFVQFNLTGLEGPLSEAKLRLTGKRTGSIPSLDSVYGVNGAGIKENVLTWNNKPTFGDRLDSTEVNSMFRVYEWNVTDYVNAKIAAGAKVVTLAVVGEPASKESITRQGGGPVFDAFHSKEAESGRPELVTFKQPTIYYPDGFDAGDGLMALNGNASFQGSRIRLTEDQNWQGGSAFYKTPMIVSAFKTKFKFQIQDPVADGLTFTLQNTGVNALGNAGGDLGYAGIDHSVAVKFDIWDNAGEGVSSTGLYQNGQSPMTPAINLLDSNVDLHSGHVFDVTMTYDGTTLVVTIQDEATGAAASQSYTVDIPAVIGTSTAFAGFTGATGGAPALQEILSWTYGK